MRPRDLIGRLIAGKMEILEHLGGGGMGWVFSAYHHALGKRVAIKVLKRMGDPLHAKRFEVEARSASRLEHPNAVTILDFGEDGPDRLVYIAMEFVEGRDVDRIIRAEAPIEPRRAAAIMVQALAGLASAHEAGVVHRDLKPANIMVTARTNDDGEPEEFVKVCDFGLAKLMDPESPAQGLTRRGMIVGTPDYMSPEQAVGDPVDGRTDVYAAGVILYEMLTGRRPFEAKEPGDVLLMHLNDIPRAPRAWVPSIPEDLERIVLWAMEKRSDQRASSARELREALKRFILRPDMFNLEAMVDVEHLKAALQPSSKPSPESITDEFEIPVLVPRSRDFESVADVQETLIDHPIRARATPQEIPIPSPVVIARPPSQPAQVELIAQPTWRSAETQTPPEAFEYQGPSPFYLMEPSPRRIGPCSYEILQGLIVQLIDSGQAPEASISIDGQHWIALQRYLELTGQQALLPGQIAEPEPGTQPLGQLSKVPATPMFAAIARQKPSGRLVIRSASGLTEVYLKDGQPVNVRSSVPTEQTPALLASRGLVSPEHLPALVHAALESDTRIEQVLGGAVDVQVLRHALMKERLLAIMSLNTGDFSFDHHGGNPQGTPFAYSLLALLPNLVFRAIPLEVLERYLAPHMQSPLHFTADSEELLDLMQASPGQRELAGQLAETSIAQALQDVPDNRAGIMPCAYVLLQSGILGLLQP